MTRVLKSMLFDGGPVNAADKPMVARNVDRWWWWKADRVVFALVVAWNFAACHPASPADPIRYERAEPHMGTLFKIVAYSNHESVANDAIGAAFERIGQLDAKLSDYRSDSELMRLCESAPHSEPVEVSRDLWDVLTRAADISRDSNGAFDVTVGHLTKLWRRARRQKEFPDPRLLDEGLRRVDYRQIEFDDSTTRVRLTRPDVRIDLGGIAKGMAAQNALDILRSRGLESAMVDAGGNLAVGSPPPGESGWKIGIAGLRREDPPVRFLRLARQSVATSGDLSQFVELRGQRYSHILDPRTGIGLSIRSSTTVVASDGATADALATAISVLGQRDGLELARRYQSELLYMWLDGETVRTIESDGFVRLAVPGDK